MEKLNGMTTPNGIQNAQTISNGIDNGHDERPGQAGVPETLNDQYKANYGAHRAGISPDEMASYYSGWACQYEQDLRPGVYNGPTIAAQELAELYPTNRDQVRILDVAAGTGLVGVKLHELGFQKIDGLDAAPGMLDECAKKQIYTNLLCDYISDKKLKIDEDTYDSVVISGGMGEGHIPCSALHEIVRIVKPGGIVCIVMRREYLEYVEEYKDKLELLMSSFMKSGQWDQIYRKIVQNYSFNKEGVVFAFRVR